jgi:dTDP-D-glucose 4,6-dehydratase
MSTDEVYGDSASIKDDIVEHELHPTNPYARSKLEGENLVAEFAFKHGTPAIVVRSNNVYGPMQYPEKVIPRFICRTLKGLSW